MRGAGLDWVAVRILVGDPRRYLGIVFGVAFATLLMAHQASVFHGVMRRTTGPIRDIHPDGIWVMDPDVQYVDEVQPLPDTSLYRVRGVDDVAWAVPLFKGAARARAGDGRYRQVILLGLDDHTLTGAPREMVAGAANDLKRPDAVIVDEAGYGYLWPGEPVRLGRELEINDHRGVLVGVCKVTPPFQSLPVVYARYQMGRRLALRERRGLSFVLAQARPGVSKDAVCARIRARTGLLALTGEAFCARTLGFYHAFTGIPLNFRVTVSIGFIVGIVVVGQTFYLFTVENLWQFGVLRAMGIDRWGLARMVFLQGLLVAAVGFGVGIGSAALLLELLTRNVQHLAGFFLPWEVLLKTGTAVAVMTGVVSFVSVRRVLALEPALVFRS